jgi:hypothetical protein
MFDYYASSNERMQTKFGISPRRRHSVHTSAAHNQDFDYLTYPSYSDVFDDVSAQESENEQQVQEDCMMDGEPQHGSEATLQETMDSLSFRIKDENQTLWDEVGKIGM